MKHSIRLTIITLIALSTFLISCGTTQSAIEKDEKARLLDNQIANLDFKFVAKYAYPQHYQAIYLSSVYDVTVSPDTVKSYLPYYGRAYRAPMNSSEGGIKFESIDFESETKKGKKDGEWLVTIKTKDTPPPFTLHFHLWSNGTAQLNVNDPDRQSITFQGFLEVPKKKE